MWAEYFQEYWKYYLCNGLRNGHRTHSLYIDRFCVLSVSLFIRRISCVLIYFKIIKPRKLSWRFFFYFKILVNWVVYIYDLHSFVWLYVWFHNFCQDILWPALHKIKKIQINKTKCLCTKECGWVFSYICKSMGYMCIHLTQTWTGWDITGELITMVLHPDYDNMCFFFFLTDTGACEQQLNIITCADNISAMRHVHSWPYYYIVPSSISKQFN